MRYWFTNYPFALLLVPLIAFILCCHYAHWPMQLTEKSHSVIEDTTRAFYPVAVLSMPQPREKTCRYEACVLNDQQPRFLLYLRNDSSSTMPSAGDTLLIFCRHGLSYTCFVDSYDWQMISPNRTPWWRTSLGWQHKMQQRYQQLGVSGRELATISALTLGCRDDLNPLLKRQFSAAGAMHVLAVSGLHTGILMTVLLALVTCCGYWKPLYEERVKRYILYSFVILALVAYAFLTGGTPSVVRSVIMSSMIMLSLMFHRSNQMLNALFASAFFILLFRPLDLFSVSFQLSYAAVFSIALFAPGWKRAMPQNYFLDILGMTIAATIGTMPVTLYHFGQISNYFLLTNFIVIPLAWLMMVGGLFTLTLGWITPIGQALAWLVNALTWLMNESVGWIDSLPYSTTMVQLPLLGMWVLLAVNVVILLLWNKFTTPQLIWK